MRNFQLSALMLIVALTFCQRPAQAQQSNPKDSQANDSELREKAFTVLESLAGQLSTLQSPENRARIGANIAESLWKRDETRARGLFLLVQDDIKSRLVIPDPEDETEMRTFLVFLKLRSDTLERIVKYDGELAYSFFKATEVDLDKLPHYMVDHERNLDLRISQKLAAQNPEVAVRLARLALARGFPDELLSVLARLMKHKDQALLLYKEIVQKLRNTEIKQDWRARQFIYSLAHLQPPVIDELAFRDFVGFVIATSGPNGCDGKSVTDNEAEFCQWRASVLEKVEKFVDPRAARLKRSTTERYAYESEQPQAARELEELAEEGSVNEILELARKYPNLTADIHWHALMKARVAGDIDQMRKIAGEFNGNPEVRQQMLDEVARAERAAIFDEAELVELQKKLNETPQVQERVMLLRSSAYRAGARNPKTALKLVKQADQLVETMSPGSEQTLDQMGVAVLYCLEKNDRGFAIMESVVPKLNSLVDAAVKLDGFDTSYLRDGEWNMSANGSVGQLLTQLSKAAEFFAWSDFDRAMTLATQFERPEIRMMAQLKLAQSILAGPHKRFPVH